LSLLDPEEDMRLTFKETYPEGCAMPFQGAWPIDIWALEATISDHPELWWKEGLECACGNEAAMSYMGKYLCHNCFRPLAAPPAPGRRIG
jgi:hypothetical protein